MNVYRNKIEEAHAYLGLGGIYLAVSAFHDENPSILFSVECGNASTSAHISPDAARKFGAALIAAADALAGASQQAAA